MTEHREEVEVMLKAREAELQRGLTERAERAEREERQRMLRKAV